jgi:transcription initiation factor TFIIIB Brf1 subunit/transcription initiation factor TFIIB
MTFTTIDDFYVSESELTEYNPSLVRHGVSLDEERWLRRYSCSIIWQVCVRLQLPVTVGCTAQVLFHRFYCKQSMAEFDVRVMSAAAFWMACKLEEVIKCDDASTLRLRDVLVMFYDCIRRYGETGKDTVMYLLNLHSPFYSLYKEAVIKSERDMLRCFGFVMHVEHSIPFVLTLGAQLGLAQCKDVLQTACDIASDSLRTTLCVRAKAESVASAALFLATEKHGRALPDLWWEGVGVDWASMNVCCSVLVDFYEENIEGKSYKSLSPAFLRFDADSDAILVSKEDFSREISPVG